jgi:hypothetical protein
VPNNNLLDSLRSLAVRCGLSANTVQYMSMPEIIRAAALLSGVYADPCVVSSTTNVTIATIKNGDLLNGVTLATGDRILLTGQTDPKENGIYVIGATAGTTVRSADTLVAGIEVPVVEGTINADTIWQLSTNDPIEVGVTELTFIKIALDTSLLLWRTALGANSYATSGTSAFQVQVSADTQPRFEMLADGTMKWGTGSAASTMGIKYVNNQLQLSHAPIIADTTCDILITANADTQTPLVLQAHSATQSVNLLECQGSGGFVGVYVEGNAIALHSESQIWLATIGLWDVSALRMGSAQQFVFSSTAVAAGAPDISLSRKAANVIGIGDGGTSDAIRIGASGRVYGNSSATVNVSTVSWTGSVATFDCATAHNLVAGMTVTVAGVTPSGYNGTFVVAAVTDTDTFTCRIFADPGAYSTGGTVAPAAQLVLGTANLTTYSHGSLGVVKINSSSTSNPCLDMTVPRNGSLIRWFDALYGTDGTWMGILNIVTATPTLNADCIQYNNRSRLDVSGVRIARDSTLVWSNNATGSSNDATLGLQQAAAGRMRITDGITGYGYGGLEVAQIQEKVNVLGNCTGNKTLDLSLGNVVSATLTGSGTWTITNPAAAGLCSTVTIWLTNGGAFTITWAVPPMWAGGIAPTLTASGLDILTLETIDGGTTWSASVALDVKVPA